MVADSFLDALAADHSTVRLSLPELLRVGWQYHSSEPVSMRDGALRQLWRFRLTARGLHRQHVTAAAVRHALHDAERWAHTGTGVSLWALAALPDGGERRWSVQWPAVLRADAQRRLAAVDHARLADGHQRRLLRSRAAARERDALVQLLRWAQAERQIAAPTSRCSGRLVTGTSWWNVMAGAFFGDHPELGAHERRIVEVMRAQQLLHVTPDGDLQLTDVGRAWTAEQVERAARWWLTVESNVSCDHRDRVAAIS